MLIEELAEEARAQLKKLSGQEAFLDFSDFGDFSSPLPLKVGRETGRKPEELSEEWAGKIKVRGLKAGATRGFLNFSLTRATLKQNLREILRFPKAEKTVVIDYSSPNIAKPFSVGHLRSTIIGESLRRVFDFLGWQAHGLNFVGDWGTQFGKLLAAFDRWPAELEEDPIKQLLALYVKFHDEVEADETLDDEAHEWFRRLEAGDQEATERWMKFRELSIREFQKIYGRLGTSKLVDASESLFVEEGKELVDKMLKKKMAETERGAVIVPLEGKPPLILRKSDGTTIYSSRDLASALWRYREFHPDLMLYVVGSEQTLHFRQLFDVLEKMKLKAGMEHVAFGMVRLPEGKMSTRKGRVIFLEEVLDEAVNRVKKIMKGRKGSEEDAEKIGIGAVKFADLKTNRTRNVMFTWDILSFEGDTGPYVQYTAVRAKRIGEKFGKGTPDIDDAFEPLARKLVRFRIAVLETARLRRPDIMASYLLELCKVFNELYVKERIGGVKGREWLAERTHAVLEKGLELLGIEVPKKM